jgi:hypothetical protein
MGGGSRARIVCAYALRVRVARVGMYARVGVRPVDKPVDNSHSSDHAPDMSPPTPTHALDEMMQMHY